MTLDDKVTTDRRDVFSMIACAEDYGHTNGVMADWLATLLDRQMSDYEIGAYGAEVEAQEGYGEEDRERAIETLMRFRERHMR